MTRSRNRIAAAIVAVALVFTALYYVAHAAPSAPLYSAPVAFVHDDGSPTAEPTPITPVPVWPTTIADYTQDPEAIAGITEMPATGAGTTAHQQVQRDHVGYGHYITTVCRNGYYQDMYAHAYSWGYYTGHYYDFYYYNNTWYRC